MATATAIVGAEDSTAAVDEGWILPTDAFVEILLRLPPTKRWWLRLVCRHWRDVIRERTPPPELPTALAFFVNYSDHTPKKLFVSAYTIDDPEEGRGRELWRSKLVAPTHRFNNYVYPPRYEYVDASKPQTVGTCNGLLCLCDGIRPGGAIALLNPTTGDTLVVPPLPGSAQWVRWGMEIGSWHEAYSFTYHPEIGRYKIVHVPCYFDRSGGFSEMQVFTPGEPSWRNVPVPGGSCRIDAGLVSIDGVTHWLTKDTQRVVSFDLKEERITSTMAVPMRSDQGYSWRLTEVHGRLAFVSSPSVRRRTPVKTPGIIDVWVLGAGRDQHGWIHRYSVNIAVQQKLAWPHFVHGDHVLTVERNYKHNYVFAHKMQAARRSRCSKVRYMCITEQGQLVSGGESADICGVFAYITTEEPLCVYKSKKAP